MRQNLTKSKTRVAWQSLALYTLLFISGCDKRKTPVVDESDKAIIAVLISTPIHYGTDGACESDTLEQPKIQSLLRDYDSKLIGVLIEHLTDETPVVACVGDRQSYLGFISFDLLCSIIEANDGWYNMTYGDDGIWANVREKYWISPYTHCDSRSLRTIQSRWKKLYATGKLKIDKARIQSLLHPEK